jgi:hypothetical protein
VPAVSSAAPERTSCWKRAHSSSSSTAEAAAAVSCDLSLTFLPSRVLLLLPGSPALRLELSPFDPEAEAALLDMDCRWLGRGSLACEDAGI